MVPSRILFNRSTGLGNRAVEPGDVLVCPDEISEQLAREVLASGQAQLAPDASAAPAPVSPKKGGKP